MISLSPFLSLAVVHITHRAAWPHDDVDCTLTIHYDAAPSWQP